MLLCVFIMDKELMKKKIVFIIVIISILIISFISLCVIGMMNLKVLRVGVRGNLVNYGYYNSDSGRYSGFEIDLAKELANKMGYDKVEFVTVDVNDREEMLLNNEVDCLIACYTYTDTRNEKFYLTSPYFRDNFEIIAMETTMFNKLNDLDGCSIGIIDSDAIYLQLVDILKDNNINNYTIKRYESYDEMGIDFNTGDVDSIAVDGALESNFYVEEYTKILYEQENFSDYCIALKKDSSICKEVELKLKSLLEDGYVEELKARWGID